MHEVSSGSGAVGRGGVNVTVVKYLDDVPTTTQLKKLIADAGLTVREAVRTGEAEYKELGLADASDDALLDAMVAHPRLIQRPFVVTAKGTRMARPTEAVDEIL
ncbi:arsC family protein [Mycobacteroides abscessus subsp. bolletii 1513]|uniref:ArsC family protein n=1 Tax=Mycobacteroides abscessus subsp. bolletii 1513 TaxID=1299321 RepID=X8E0U8_9MYCO|nr:arsC family protein [Mycobacteroides abscessus subsp. bolletii 1513]